MNINMISDFLKHFFFAIYKLEKNSIPYNLLLVTESINNKKLTDFLFVLDIAKDSSPMMKDTVEKLKKMIGKSRNYGKELRCWIFFSKILT